ncbi:uncharacterized protein [Glycine max]|uniref:uncharacterized protein isoform X3 n=1 Tax=Glycine max TaxID=3847 RepID=UPI001B355214|nr:uncharacterized protein LOC100814556 isoform X3 [Glycine max]
MLNVHALSGLDDKEIYHTFVKVISQCHMLAYLEAINHIFVFPEELVLPFFKSWATCVYYKDMGKRWYILVVLKHCSTRNLYHKYPSYI